MKIGFLVGDIVHISGGSNVIIEHAAELTRLGHEVVLIPARVEDDTQWHPRLKGLAIRPIDVAAEERFDFVFATWWLTYFQLYRLNARVYGYFNQSVESRFHGEWHQKQANRATYSLPIFFVTEARWIAQYIQMLRPDAPCAYVPNGLSTDYFPRQARVAPRSEGPLRVLVEGPWNVGFKGVAETFQLLEEASSRVPMEIGWLTSRSAGHQPTVGGHKVQIHEHLPIDQVAAVLGKYDVMVKLSRVEGMFGPPLEMYSQGGTAITLNVTGHDEFMVHGHNGLVVPPYDLPQVVNYLEELSAHPDRLQRLRENALATARAWPGWKESSLAFSQALEKLGPEYSNAHLRSALAGQAALVGHWLDEIGRKQREYEAQYVGPGEMILLNRYRRLKESSVGRTVRELLSPLGHRGLRRYLERVLK